MVKFKGSEYSKLNEGTKKRLESTLIKANETGFSINELLEMNDKEFRAVYKTKAKNLDSQRSLLRQVKGTPSRKQLNINRVIQKFKIEGKPEPKLQQIKKGLVKTVGHTFDTIYSELQKEYQFENKEKGYEYTRQLLKIPVKDMDNLNDFDKELIEGYDTTP